MRSGGEVWRAVLAVSGVVLALQQPVVRAEGAARADLDRAWLDELVARASGPPSADELQDVREGKAGRLVSEAELRRLRATGAEAEQVLLGQLRGGGVAAAVWLGYLQCREALPILRHLLLTDRYFYGWEGPDPSKEESYLQDDQYTHHAAYIAAIEAIAGRPVREAVGLTEAERRALEREAAKASVSGNTSAYTARWLLGKLAAGQLPPSAPTSLRDCVGLDRRLEGGVSISVVKEADGTFTATFRGARFTAHRSFGRDASFYGSAAAPGVILIHDRYLSNEDALEMQDLDHAGVKSIRIGHPDSGTYGHTHYLDAELRGLELRCVEKQWAPNGNGPSRRREVMLSLSSFGELKTFRWIYEKAP